MLLRPDIFYTILPRYVRQETLNLRGLLLRGA